MRKYKSYFVLLYMQIKQEWRIDKQKLYHTQLTP